MTSVARISHSDRSNFKNEIPRRNDCVAAIASIQECRKQFHFISCAKAKKLFRVSDLHRTLVVRLVICNNHRRHRAFGILPVYIIIVILHFAVM